MKKLKQAYKENKTLFAAGILVCLMFTALFIWAITYKIGDFAQSVSGFFTAAVWVIFYFTATTPPIEEAPKDLQED